MGRGKREGCFGLVLWLPGLGRATLALLHKVILALALVPVLALAQDVACFHLGGRRTANIVLS